MKEQLLTFPIHANQHGFCTDKSTESAISNTLINIKNNTSHKKHTIVSSLDIQAVFDSILPGKIKLALLKYGSNKDFANWYHNYLTHRDLHTELNGEIYEATTSIGFPQGGVVSADFWKIAFNPAMEIINNEHTTGTGYADDLILMASGYKHSTTMQKLQQVLNKLTTWGKTHGLQFNAAKTVAVYFTQSKHSNPDVHITMEGKAIEYSSSFKYLGVTIDNKLSWREHRESVIKTAKNNLMKLTNKIATINGPNPQISK